MADKILKQNKIPGCERLTRPEEIKALSKYLRNIRKTLEENTDLEETTLEVPGKTTGQFHNISELPQGKETLDPNHTIDALETERLDLEDSRTPNLSTYREGLEDKRNPALSDYREGLDDDREVELSDYKDELEDERETKLSDYRDDLEDYRDTELSDYREDLEDNRTPELSDYQDKLEDGREQKLSDYKDTIEDTRDVELSDYKESIEIDKDIVLPDFKDTIADNRDTSLSDYKDTIEDTREPELPDYKDSLTDDRTLELSDYQDKLEDKRNIGLSNYKDNLEDSREQELSDYRDDLEDTRNVELSDFKDTIVDEREPELSEYKETISNIPEPELPGITEELGGESKVISSLPDFKDTIEDTREPELPDYKDSLTDNRESELEDTRLDIIDEREFELGDTRVDISDTRDNSLSDVKIDIVDQREPELSNVKLDIQDDRNLELPDTKLNLTDTRENALSDYRDDLIDERENSLSKYQESFEGEVNEVESLYDAVLGLEDNREPKLPNHIENLEDNRKQELEDFQDTLTDDREPELSDHIENLEDSREPVLEDFQDTLTDDREPELPDYKNELTDEREPELSDYQEELTDEREPELSNTIIDRPENNEEEARVDGVFPNNEWNTDGSPGYYGSFDDVIPKLVDNREIELSDVLIEAIESENPDPLYETLRNISDGDFYNFILQILNERDNDSDLDIDLEWKEKIAALVSTYLNPGDDNKPISPRNAHRFEDELFRSIRLADGDKEIEGELSKNSDGTGRIDGEYDFIDGTSTTNTQVKKHTEDQYKDVPFMQLPEDSTIFDKVEYIRFAAENIVGWMGIGNDRLRKFLLTETLWALVLARRGVEKTTGINRDRLPGRQNGIGTLIDDAKNLYEAYKDGNLINSAIGLFAKYLREKPNPINRPEVDWKGLPKNNTVDFELGNDRYNVNKKKGIVGKLTNLWNNLVNTVTGFFNNDRPYKFKDNYLKGGGIATTLSDLCEGKTSDSVEGLLEIFKNSPYITTPSQFGTIHEGSYGTQTLDSNSYWEVIIEPLCDDYLNGGYSYLPCFNEINVINMAAHGVETSYNKWVPISNFELQKAKLTTKSVGLYDGEFSFPVSSELTNEIRFTIVDDQYKSWRNYFQKCMDVAVYNSEPHNENYYKNGGVTMLTPLIMSPTGLSDVVTAVDKSIITVAFYKNITFRIRIYIMTPQYSTIRRFDLLCVLKDFSEEYSGDIDSGGVDLNVTFSIVGENPEGADQENIGELNRTFLNDNYNLERLDNGEQVDGSWMSTRHDTAMSFFG